jgi:hypothetical protein
MLTARCSRVSWVTTTMGRSTTRSTCSVCTWVRNTWVIVWNTHGNVIILCNKMKIKKNITLSEQYVCTSDVTVKRFKEEMFEFLSVTSGSSIVCFLLNWSCPIGVRPRVMIVNATLNNMSVISWRSVLIVEEIGENHRTAASYSQPYNIMLYLVFFYWAGFELSR